MPSENLQNELEIGPNELRLPKSTKEMLSNDANTIELVYE